MPAFRRGPASAAARGEVAEWLKAHAWNACIGETLSRVRIPLSPPSSPCELAPSLAVRVTGGAGPGTTIRSFLFVNPSMAARCATSIDIPASTAAAVRISTWIWESLLMMSSRLGALMRPPPRRARTGRARTSSATLPLGRKSSRRPGLARTSASRQKGKLGPMRRADIQPVSRPTRGAVRRPHGQSPDLHIERGPPNASSL